jgi:hypothetical protein
MTLRAMRLSGVLGSPGRDGTHEVFAARHWLQVLRIHAARIPAKVVQLQAFGDRPDEEFVGHAMHLAWLPPSIDLPISPAVECAQPLPTAVRDRAVDAPPKASSNVDLELVIAGGAANKPCAPTSVRVPETQGDPPWVKPPAVHAVRGRFCSPNCLSHRGRPSRSPGLTY